MTLYEREGDDIDRGLVGYWKLDDLKISTSTAIDKANFNDGTITGATVADGLNWNPSNSMSFDGNDIINLGTPSDLDLRVKASISVWIKFDTLNPVAGSPSIFNSAGGGGTERGLDISFVDAINKIAFGISNNGTQVAFVLTTKSDWSLDTWYHIVIVWDSTAVSDNLQFYIDGNAENSSNDTDVPDGISNDITIGDEWEGNISNLRIYNRALTSGEASKLYRLKK